MPHILYTLISPAEERSRVRLHGSFCVILMARNEIYGGDGRDHNPAGNDFFVFLPGCGKFKLILVRMYHA